MRAIWIVRLASGWQLTQHQWRTGIGLLTLAVLLALARLAPAASADPLSPHAGKVVLVDFWASWCEPCRRSFPWMNDMQQKYEQDGLVIVAVNVDNDLAAAQRFLKENRANFQVHYDDRQVAGPALRSGRDAEFLPSGRQRPARGESSRFQGPETGRIRSSHSRCARQGIITHASPTVMERRHSRACCAVQRLCRNGSRALGQGCTCAQGHATRSESRRSGPRRSHLLQQGSLERRPRFRRRWLWLQLGP